jgi:hypothetical protein
VALVAAVLAVGGVGGFLVGAAVRTGAAEESGLTAQAQQNQQATDLSAVVARIDLGGYLGQALLYQDDPALRDAVAWQAQAGAVIPRFLWPEKPTVDYGTRVSAAAYGMHDTRSSSTISTLGDTVVNWGMAGVVIAGVVLGALLGWTERRVRAGTGVAALVLAAGLSAFVVQQEMPLLLWVIAMVRTMLVVSAVWVVATVAGRRGHVPTAGPKTSPSLGTPNTTTSILSGR